MNGPEAVFKQHNSCSNHEIHVDFERLISQDGLYFVNVTLSNVMLSP